MQRTPLAIGQILDARPPDVAAVRAFRAHLPQRQLLCLPMTAAAEALDDE
jgi:hypothetical protein